MKKMFRYWWKELIWEWLCVKLPLFLTLIFAFLVFTYWQDFAALKILIFLIASGVACNRLFNK
ncbi:MAG TPA: hypothetical protein DEF05_00210 [Erwinia sp.]|nr:hypothetical protein [Erwinia sp.]